MSSKPVIAVTGATGAQGGSVVQFLLKDGGFHVRALTRKVDSDAAKELKEKGVEVVKADFNDVKSLEDAFKGAHGVFALTNYWDPSVFNEEKEFVQGKLLVDAAKKAGVKHFVYSTLELWNDPPVEHFNAKYRINKYLIDSGLPRTSVYTDFYFENFTNPAMSVFAFKKNPALPGTYLAEWPLLWSDGLIPGYAVADTGAYVLAAFKDPGRWIGKDIKILTEIFTPRQLVALVEELSGKKIELKEISYESFGESKNGGPFAAELYANMEAFYKTNATMGRTEQEIQEAKKIYPEETTLREFVKANVDKLLPQ